jgi:hypothetical protein
MTIFEQEQFEQLAEDFISQAKVAIKTKPIKRKMVIKDEGGQPSFKSFEAVANTSGKLADSLRYEISENEINVYAFSYFDSLVYGKAPSRLDATVFEIETWMAQKGIESISSATIMNNIQEFGTSIFREFQGRESNFLEDIDMTSHIETVKQNLILKKINEITYANS